MKMQIGGNGTKVSTCGCVYHTSSAVQLWSLTRNSTAPASDLWKWEKATNHFGHVWIPFRPQSRSTNQFFLKVPRFSTEFGKRSSSYLAPTVWNALPPNIRLSPTFDTFKRHLKTQLFKCCPPSDCQRLWFSTITELARSWVYWGHKGSCISNKACVIPFPETFYFNDIVQNWNRDC